MHWAWAILYWRCNLYEKRGEHCLQYQFRSCTSYFFNVLNGEFINFIKKCIISWNRDLISFRLTLIPFVSVFSIGLTSFNQIYPVDFSIYCCNLRAYPEILCGSGKIRYPPRYESFNCPALELETILNQIQTTETIKRMIARGNLERVKLLENESSRTNCLVMISVQWLSKSSQTIHSLSQL